MMPLSAEPLSDKEFDWLNEFLIKHAEPKTGRNDPYPCGSGKKYKKYCLH